MVLDREWPATWGTSRDQKTPEDPFHTSSRSKEEHLNFLLFCVERRSSERFHMQENIGLSFRSTALFPPSRDFRTLWASAGKPCVFFFVHNGSYSAFFSADCKRGRRKGATSKNVKNRQKVSKSFSTLFDNFRAGQKTSKIVKKCQKVFRHFSTLFARHLFSGLFCNPLSFVWHYKNKERVLRGWT